MSFTDLIGWLFQISVVGLCVFQSLWSIFFQVCSLKLSDWNDLFKLTYSLQRLFYTNFNKSTPTCAQPTGSLITLGSEMLQTQILRLRNLQHSLSLSRCLAAFGSLVLPPFPGSSSRSHVHSGLVFFPPLLPHSLLGLKLFCSIINFQTESATQEKWSHVFMHTPLWQCCLTCSVWHGMMLPVSFVSPLWQKVFETKQKIS